jgi:hypothetical protein
LSLLFDGFVKHDFIIIIIIIIIITVILIMVMSCEANSTDLPAPDGEMRDVAH